MTDRRVLAISGIAVSEAALQQLAATMELELEELASPADFQQLSTNTPICCVISCEQEVGRKLCAALRASAPLAEVPLLAVVGDPWSEEISEAFSLGVDDFICKADILHLERKVQALRSRGAPEGNSLSGKVLLADSSPARRAQLARHLRKLGMDVRFAADLDQDGEDSTTTLIIAGLDVAPHGAVAALKAFRAAGGKSAWIICGSKEQLLAGKLELGDEPNVAFLDIESDTAQIAFLANKLLSGAQRSLRKSQRLTFETPIMFDTCGGERPEYGFTYNISRGGLYVRTLTPPGIGVDLDLEFRVPFGRGRVALSGKVAWRQEYRPGRGYPTGFGVQFAEDLPIPDLAALIAGYKLLLEDSGDPVAIQ